MTLNLYLTHTLRYINHRSANIAYRFTDCFANIVDHFTNLVARWTRREPRDVNVYGGTFNIAYGPLIIRNHRPQDEVPSSVSEGLGPGIEVDARQGGCYTHHKESSGPHGLHRDMYDVVEAGEALEAVGMAMSAS